MTGLSRPHPMLNKRTTMAIEDLSYMAESTAIEGPHDTPQVS
jgi:hypothetical protein